MIQDNKNNFERAGFAPVSDLVSDLREEAAHLFKTTTQLLRVELKQNVENATSGLAQVVGGAVVLGIALTLALLGLDLLAIALLAPDILSYETAAWVCTLTLAAILGIVGTILLKKNKKKLSAESLIPNKTLETIEEHADWLARKAGELAK